MYVNELAGDCQQTCRSALKPSVLLRKLGGDAPRAGVLSSVIYELSGYEHVDTILCTTALAISGTTRPLARSRAPSWGSAEC